MDEEINIPNNLEIDKALKEFEEKSRAEQIQKSPEVLQNSEIPKIVQATMKYSGVKERKQAEYILLFFIVLAFAISLFLFFGGGNFMNKNSGIDALRNAPQGANILK